jgi:hypothetical protein
MSGPAYTRAVPRHLWSRWKRLAHRAAEVQSLVVLALLYWIVVVPVGLLRKLGRRPSALPEWKTRPAPGPLSVEDARRQY